MTQWF